MFRCKECGCEYEVKPDYCDCGNNTFDEIVIQQPPKQEPIQATKQIKEDRPAVYPKKTDVPHKTSNKTFSEQYPEFDRIKKNFDPISTVVFVLCLITSLIVLFFVGNPEPKVTENTTTQQEEKPQIVIPSIDTFWNNSTAGIINYEKTTAQKAAHSQTNPQQQTQQTNPLIGLIQPKQQEQPIQTPVSQQQVPQPVKVQTPKQTQTQQLTKPQQTQQKTQPTTQNNTIVGKIFGNNNNNNQTTNNNTQKQNTQTQQKAQSKQTNVSPKIPTTTQNIATQPQNTTINKSSQTTVTTQTQKTNTQTTTSNNKITTKPATSKPNTTINIPSNNTLRPQATIDTQALKRELDNYKIGLRNTLGRKVDFTKVIGDGECVVAFKIASNGKLTNRSFAKQSSNITLNDAVYSAIMSTPNYNPPPSGYKNETLNLKIRFYGGNYDVSLY